MPTFLVVDDSRVMRQLVQRVVRQAGFEQAEFLEAANGREALGLLQDRDYAVDVVLCDLYMPQMNGREFLQAVAAQDKLETCPVVMVTSDATAVSRSSSNGRS